MSLTTVEADLSRWPPLSVALEVELSHVFAAAASVAGVKEVHLKICCSGTASSPSWNRKDLDDLLRSVDRCQQRIFPPLDSLQYLSQTSPRFDTDEAERLWMVFEVRPTLSFVRDPHIPWPSSASEGVHVVDGQPPREGRMKWPATMETLSSGLNVSPHVVSHTDAELWGLARGARQKYLEKHGHEGDGDSNSASASVRSGAAVPHDAAEEVDSDAGKRFTVLQWRSARWVAETFVNQTSWAQPAPSLVGGGGRSAGRRKSSTDVESFTPASPDILEAARAQPMHRYRHADGRGIECVLVCVGCTSRYAYLAAPSQSESSLVLLARVPIPEALSHHHRGERKRSHTSVALQFFQNVEEVMAHDDVASFVRLASEEETKVCIRAHTVCCCGFYPDSSGAVRAGSDVSVVLEDCFVRAVHRSDDTAVEVHCVRDVLDLVRRSCRRYLATSRHMRVKAQEQSNSLHDAVSIAAQALELLRHITDSTCVRFKKLRGGVVAAAVPVIRTCRDVYPLREGATVEFKQHVHVNEPARRGFTSTHDRLRHTIAAMANTLGGVVVVGVTDSGEVVGHIPGEVRNAMRVTGFCPAMVKDSVTLRELPVLRKDSALHDATTTSLCTDWWKTGRMTPTGPQGEGGKVFTVLTVSRGQAPFYCVTRDALPYKRMCASTTPMSLWQMTLRLYAHLS